MSLKKLAIVGLMPAVMAASCNQSPGLPDPDAGYSWQTINTASGLNDQARQGYVGPPTWSEDGSLVSGVEQYYQRKDICNGFPVCNGYSTKDYRFRVFTQSLGSDQRLYLNDIAPGIVANLFHQEQAGYWLMTSQTEGPNAELVFARITRSAAPVELGRERLDYADRHDTWWLPSPNGEHIGRAVCNRMPQFDTGNPSFDAITDTLSGNTIPYGHCGLTFISPSTGELQGNMVLVEFPWSTAGWNAHNEPYDFNNLPRYGFPYWRTDGSFAVSDYQNAAFSLYPGDAQAISVNLRPCQGPLTASSAISPSGDILSSVNGEITVVAQHANNRFDDCNL